MTTTTVAAKRQSDTGEKMATINVDKIQAFSKVIVGRKIIAVGDDKIKLDDGRVLYLADGEMENVVG